MILFTPEMVDKIKRGEKTETRRRHKVFLHLGAVHQVKTRLFGAIECRVKITVRDQEPYPGARYHWLREPLSLAARREGFESWEAFRDWWKERYGEAALRQPCKWYRFEVVRDD